MSVEQKGSVMKVLVEARFEGRYCAPDCLCLHRERGDSLRIFGGPAFYCALEPENSLPFSRVEPDGCALRFRRNRSCELYEFEEAGISGYVDRIERGVWGRVSIR